MVAAEGGSPEQRIQAVVIREETDPRDLQWEIMCIGETRMVYFSRPYMNGNTQGVGSRHNEFSKIMPESRCRRQQRVALPDL